MADKTLAEAFQDLKTAVQQVKDEFEKAAIKFTINSKEVEEFDGINYDADNQEAVTINTGGETFSVSSPSSIDSLAISEPPTQKVIGPGKKKTYKEKYGFDIGEVHQQIAEAYEQQMINSLGVGSGQDHGASLDEPEEDEDITLMEWD